MLHKEEAGLTVDRSLEGIYYIYISSLKNIFFEFIALSEKEFL